MRPLTRPLAALAAPLALAAALTGCDDEPPAPDPWLELGSTAEPFGHRPLTDGDTVPITYGLQGGYHIWGSLTGDHFDPDPVRMQFALYDGDRQIGGADYRDDLRRPAPGEPFEYGGVTVFIYDDVPPDTLDGRTITMTLTLTAGSVVLEDRREVVPRCCE